MKEFEKLGFKLVEENYDKGTNSTNYIFERTVRKDETHQLILEDYRWQQNEPGFDPGKSYDIGDWLIHSCTKNTEKDWFGNEIDEPYPLTLTEMKAIIDFIERRNE